MLDANDSVLERSSHCLDGCRYDRSNPGYEDPSSNPFPERWLYQDGGEYVLFDERGPGAITRLWVTTGFGVSTCIDPATRVRFYVDGAAAPTLDVPLAALFDGSTAPFTAPLVADHLLSSGGYVSYVPIAYARSLRVTLVDAENGGTNPCTGTSQRLLWFQVQFHQLRPGTAVTSFSPAADFSAWRAFLAHAGDDPWDGMLMPQELTSTLVPGATLDLAERQGAGWLRGIRLRLPRSAYADVNLRVTIDGLPAVDVPLGDFFATSPASTIPTQSVLVGEDAAGWLYAWWPMPFRSAVKVQLIADAGLASPIPVDSALSFDSASIPEDAGTFATRLTDTCVAGGDLQLYEDRGAGKLVGLSARYHADGNVGRGYLEGDERAYIDGAIAPGWYGTGVEDFYNGGFYFDQGAYSRALSGATAVDADGSGTTAAYRWLLTDPLTYTSALRLTQEAGLSPTEPIPMCARTTIHGYRQPQGLTVAYDAFTVGDDANALAHGYTPPGDATCAPMSGMFEDEPPTVRNADSCTYSGGSSAFRFTVTAGMSAFRLLRSFDVGGEIPGSNAGSAAAEIRVNGTVAGYFPPAIANPTRRWQQQEALLDVQNAGASLEIEIIPVFAPATPVFSESTYELRGAWKDGIFADGFD